MPQPSCHAPNSSRCPFISDLLTCITTPRLNRPHGKVHVPDPRQPPTSTALPLGLLYRVFSYLTSVSIDPTARSTYPPAAADQYCLAPGSSYLVFATSPLSRSTPRQGPRTRYPRQPPTSTALPLGPPLLYSGCLSAVSSGLTARC